MYSVCVVELLDTVRYRKILGVVKECFCDKFMSPVKNNWVVGILFIILMLHWNKRMFVCSWSSLKYSLAKQIVMTYRSLRSFSVTRSERINQLWSKKYWILCVYAYILAVVIQQANCVFYIPHYCVNGGLSGSTIFLHISDK